MAQDTGGHGHPAASMGVEAGVSPLHDIDTQTASPPHRPFRCFRHHVWMAACDDCHEEHAPAMRGEKHTGDDPRSGRGRMAP